MNEKYSKEIYERELLCVREKYKKVCDLIENNPPTLLLKAHTDFNQFLEDYKGSERTSKEGVEEFGKISRRYDVAKKAMKSYSTENQMKLLDEKLELQLKLSYLKSEIFYIDMRLKKEFN